MTTARAAPGRRAVLMVIDGLRGDLVDAAHVPCLARLAETSRHYRCHRSVFPSATRVNSASIATGCFPASHGLAGNAIALDEGRGLAPVSVGPAEFRERWRRATGATLRSPTLAERLAGAGDVRVYSNSSPGAAHMQDPDRHGWLFHRTGSHAPGGAPVAGAEELDVSYDGAGDLATTQRFCADLSERPHAAGAWVLWICEPDHSQHQLELGSPEHRDVLAGSDRCLERVAAAVDDVRAGGEDVLFVVCSDHGHETVDEIVPVELLMVQSGLKESLDSPDVVLASSGMGALVYRSAQARVGAGELARWLREQAWVEAVFAGERLREVGQRPGSSLAAAFAMRKRDGVNRFGIRGFGHVAGDRFTTTDRTGFGQHGGLGRYETNPVLLVSGSEFPAGATRHPSRAVDIAPTILRHLRVPAPGMDGVPLQRYV